MYQHPSGIDSYSFRFRHFDLDDLDKISLSFVLGSKKKKGTTSRGEEAEDEESGLSCIDPFPFFLG